MMKPDSHSPLSGVTLWLAAIMFAALLTAFGWFERGTPFSVDPVKLNDAMVRMVMVRDWLNGQSWFDPTLSRLGLDPGTLMHWSRLIDLPLGVLVASGNLLGFEGEHFASIVWPFLVFVAACAGMICAVQRFSGSANPLPAFLIGGFGLFETGVFESGFVDHHNVQLALMLWLIALLTPRAKTMRCDMRVAGILTAFMLAIGMEGLPLAIAGGLAIFLRLVVEKEAFFKGARAYALSLAVSVSLLFFLLVGPANYLAAHCDSFSTFQLVCAGLGGLCLWAGFHRSFVNRVPRAELTIPLLSGAAVLAMALLFFPDCLGDPVGNLDPKLRLFWFDKIGETQSFWQILPVDPWLLAMMHVLPLIALVAGGMEIIRRYPHSSLNPAMVFLAVTIAISLFQMRGTNFAVSAATTILAMLVSRFGVGTDKPKPVLFVSAIVFSCAIVWRLLFAFLFVTFDVTPGPYLSGSFLSRNATCKSHSAIEAIKSEPNGLVAVATSIGAKLLYETDHRILSASYHRNTKGNLAWINAMTGSPQDARRIFADNGVTLLAFCPTDIDEMKFRTEVPEGFAAILAKGEVPVWLEPVKAGSTDGLQLYRVIP